MPTPLLLGATLAFVLIVVATPAGAWTAYGLYGVLVVAALVAACVPPATVARRSLVETPFLVFAALMPFVSAGPTATVWGLTLSVPGLVAGATLACKATLGVLAAIVLASATTGPGLVDALQRLRVPATLVAILAFMVRYAAVLVADVTRMRIAREARGAPRSRLALLAAVAGGVGALFVRTYERGERVARAMTARGYSGTMPALGDSASATAGQVAAVAVLPLAALGVCAATWAGLLGAAT